MGLSMKLNKQYQVIGGIVLLGFVVIVGFRIFYHKGAQVTAPTLTSGVAIIPTIQKKITHRSPQLSYTDAVALYSNGRRIQFDEVCQAKPSRAVFSNGTIIMIDNRSAQDRTIKIGDTTYAIKPYSYRLAKLSASKIPTTYLVDCDNQQNPATIIVE
jgi:hypothetical protein